MDESKKTNNISYQLQTTIKIHDKSVMHFIILNDLRYASSACDNSIKIFNKTTYKIDIIILEHENYVAYIYQLKDGRLVSSSSDNTIKIFKLFKKSYNVEQILTGHTKPCKKTIELINGSLLSCSWDQSIILWEKDKNNLYKNNLQFKEMMEVCAVYEINDKEFISISTKDNHEENNRAISFYKMKNGEFDILDIIDNLNISAFLSNVIIIDKYILVGGEYKIYFIDKITHSINKIFELGEQLWAQSLYLLSNGNLIVGAEFDLLIFKIIDNNLEMILDIKDIQKTNDICDYGVISTIKEDDFNKNIIISLYNGEIKVFQKIKDN